MTQLGHVKVVCGPTGKEVHSSAAKAYSCSLRLEAKLGRAYRVYQCTSCGFWHLTTHRKAIR